MATVDRWPLLTGDHCVGVTNIMRKLKMSHFKLIHKINVLFSVQNPGFGAKSRLMKANDFRNRDHV